MYLPSENRLSIVILPDDYLPDGTRAHAKMLHDLALALLQRGHKPIIITPGVREQPSRLVIDFIDGVEVWRFRSRPTRGVSMLSRGLTELLLSPRAWIAVRKHLKERRIDLCINYSPTIFLAGFAFILKLQGAKVYLILRDFFPQWMIDQGRLSEHSLITRFFRAMEKFNYSISDKIGVQSPGNKIIFSKHNPEYHARCEVLFNWGSARKNIAHPLSNELLELIKPYEEKILFFYGGNLGYAQDMNNLIILAQNLIHRDDAHFLFIGDGDQAHIVSDAAKSMKNVSYSRSVKQHEYETLLKHVDVGLFSLAAHHSAHNFPGKLLGYMANELPILGSVNQGNDLKEVIENARCGFVLRNGEDKKLSSAAEQLIVNQQLRHEMGQNSKQLYIEKFSVDIAAEKILTLNSQAKD